MKQWEPTENLEQAELRKIRWALSLVIFGLVISGVTAFPLLGELNMIAGWLSDGGDLNPGHYTGLTHWILHVREGLEVSYQSYPFIAYGTDWLAFAHLMIALYFILPWLDPARYIGVIYIGILSSVMIIPLALICGEIRGIPFAWRLVDCSFGVFCLPPLWYALKNVKGNVLT
ncbi:MAG: hypothetical protein ACSHX6_05090 [Akkermansiaceae bacterium]